MEIDQFVGLAGTHLHADHSSGREVFGFYWRFLPDRTAQMLVYPDVAAHLWDGHLAASIQEGLQAPGKAPVRRRLKDFFQIASLREDEPVTRGPFSLLRRKTVHTLRSKDLQVT